MRRAARFAILLLAGLTAPAGSLLAQSGAAAPQGSERVLFDAANRDRAARRLPALLWDPALARAARNHALLMARSGAISHQFPGEQGLSSRIAQAGVRSSLVAENVGDADDARSLHDAWMKSPQHRANLLDSHVNAVGIGVAEQNGLLFAVEDFARLTPALSLDEQERQVGDLLAAQGLRLLAVSGDVRRTCLLDRGVVPGIHPRYLFRYQTAEIRELPSQLLVEIRTGRYQSAAVGACEPATDDGFAAFRLVVLLY